MESELHAPPQRAAILLTEAAYSLWHLVTERVNHPVFADKLNIQIWQSIYFCASVSY